MSWKKYTFLTMTLRKKTFWKITEHENKFKIVAKSMLYMEERKWSQLNNMLGLISAVILAYQMYIFSISELANAVNFERVTDKGHMFGLLISFLIDLHLHLKLILLKNVIFPQFCSSDVEKLFWTTEAMSKSTNIQFSTAKKSLFSP